MVLLVLFLLQVGIKYVPDLVSDPTTSKVTQVTYVYEKDDSAVPRVITYVLRELNKEGILASAFEVDTVSGMAVVPTQYTIAKPAAVSAGLPALVVQAIDNVTKVIKVNVDNPPTSEKLMEEIK